MNNPQASDSTPSQLDRTQMAATRTLLAVLRTGAVVSGGGTLVTELLVRGWPRWVATMLSGAFVFLGYWMMWSAVKTARVLRATLERQHPGLGFLFSHREVVVMATTLQVLIATVVVLYLVHR
jgi:hypothetical protein